MHALYFGKIKNSYLTIKKSGKKTCFVNKEHIALVAEPGSNYDGRVTPNSGKAKAILDRLKEFCLFHNLNLNSLCVVGCDGINVNASTKGGRVIADV